MNQQQHYNRHELLSDADDHSDDVQLKTMQYSGDNGDNSNDDEDTPDSLDIKPPQLISNRFGSKSKKSSTSRDKKHSREHRHKRDRHIMSSGGGGRGGDSYIRSGNDARSFGNSKSNSGVDTAIDRYEKVHSRGKQIVYNEREREREKTRYKDYDRKRDSPDRMTADRALEDLRSRLLNKRNKQESERRIDDNPNEDEYANREKVRRYDTYEAHQTHHEKDSYHYKHRTKKSVIEVIDSPEDYHDNETRDHLQEDPELIARRAKILDANREKDKRKEKAREELEARRELRRGDKECTPSPQHSTSHKRNHHHHHHRERHHSKENDDDDGMDIVEEDDDDDTESDSSTNTKSNYSESERSDGDIRTSPLSIGELTKSEHRRRLKSRSSTISSSSRSSRSVDSRPRSRSKSRSYSRSRSHSKTPSLSPPEVTRNKNNHHASPKHFDDKEKKTSASTDSTFDVDSNKASTTSATNSGETEAGKTKPEEPKYPSYYPGLQGCRSVEEFKHLNHIAEGTYGIVYRAQDKRTEEIVALKRLKMEKEREGFPITSLREINTLLKGQHPNIVTCREIVVGCNMDKIFIVMDYVEHDFKSLMETMKAKNQSFLPAEVKCLTQQLLSAVAHLHDNWILHRDLKTSNLLLSHKGILKVGDFGLAREYGSPLKPYTSVVVTLWYRAPELLLCCKEYSTPIDIWSVGCIFAEFLSMSALFPGQSETDQLNKIYKFLGTPNESIWPGYSKLPAVTKIKFTEYPVSNVRERFSRRTSELGINLLQGLLTYDPKQRLTAEMAMRSDYFKELPLPIDPAMLPTWPAKSELGTKRVLASPKPPSGGGKFKKLNASDVEDNHGFILGAGMDSRQLAMGPGFNLKF